MYLTRFQLNPSNPSARRDLSNPYDLHRTLSRAYAPDPATKPHRFLWRLERGADGLRGTTVLVQSDVAGRWDALLTDGYFDTIDADNPIDRTNFVRPERAFRFRLLANPTVTRDGKRHGLRTDDQRSDWLTRQGQRHGFRVHAHLIAGRERIRATAARKAAAMLLDAVLFEGILTPEGDPQLLRQALVAGIGPGKSLGLGMLSLAPLHAAT